MSCRLQFAVSILKGFVMRGSLFSLVMAVVAIAATYFGTPASPSPPDPADTFASASVPMTAEVFDVTYSNFASSNVPEDKVGIAALEVSRPPDLISLSGGNVTKSVTSLHETPPDAAGRREPPPGLIVPISHKVAAKQSAPSGHYETVSAGIRGRRSYQVWVADTPSAPAAPASCANGSCANGSCSAPQAFSGGGGCASCGRGRR